jgi:hypothetical protein
VVARAGTDTVRIAELTATLSYASDLGLGQPMAHCVRQTVVALRLAGLAGASGRELEATYYLGLMMNVYCHADAAEQALWFGDHISMKSDVRSARHEHGADGRVHGAAGRLARQRRGPRRRLAAFPVAGMKQVISWQAIPATCGGKRSACPRGWCSWPARSTSSPGAAGWRRRWR